MRNRKIIFLILVLILCLSACKKEDKDIDLSGINIKLSEVKIDDKKYLNNLDKFFDILKNKTKYVGASYNDFPVGVKNYKKINIKEKDKELVLFLFNKEGKFYLEQPYSGIWEINKNDYDKIVSSL